MSKKWYDDAEDRYEKKGHEMQKERYRKESRTKAAERDTQLSERIADDE